MIWVLEVKDCESRSIGDVLTGEWAVRRIGSIDSLLHLMMILPEEHPQVLVVVNLMEQFIEHAEHSLKSVAPHTKVVGITTRNEIEIINCKIGKNRRFGWNDQLQFILYIKNMIHNRETAPQNQFRDIIYNDFKLSFRILPENSEVELTVKEYQIFKCLVSRVSHCVSRDTIRNEVWGNLKVTQRTIDCYVSRLRKKLSSSEVTIENIYGGGYVLA